MNQDNNFIFCKQNLCQTYPFHTLSHSTQNIDNSILFESTAAFLDQIDSSDNKTLFKYEGSLHQLMQCCNKKYFFIRVKKIFLTLLKKQNDIDTWNSALKKFLIAHETENTKVQILTLKNLFYLKLNNNNPHITLTMLQNKWEKIEPTLKQLINAETFNQLKDIQKNIVVASFKKKLSELSLEEKNALKKLCTHLIETFMATFPYPTPMQQEYLKQLKILIDENDIITTNINVQSWYEQIIHITKKLSYFLEKFHFLMKKIITNRYVLLKYQANISLSNVIKSHNDIITIALDDKIYLLSKFADFNSAFFYQQLDAIIKEKDNLLDIYMKNNKSIPKKAFIMINKLIDAFCLNIDPLFEACFEKMKTIAFFADCSTEIEQLREDFCKKITQKIKIYGFFENEEKATVFIKNMINDFDMLDLGDIISLYTNLPSEVITALVKQALTTLKDYDLIDDTLYCELNYILDHMYTDTDKLQRHTKNLYKQLDKVIPSYITQQLKKAIDYVNFPNSPAPFELTPNDPDSLLEPITIKLLFQIKAFDTWMQKESPHIIFAKLNFFKTILFFSNDTLENNIQKYLKHILEKLKQSPVPITYSIDSYNSLEKKLNNNSLSIDIKRKDFDFEKEYLDDFKKISTNFLQTGEEYYIFYNRLDKIHEAEKLWRKDTVKYNYPISFNKCFNKIKNLLSIFIEKLPERKKNELIHQLNNTKNLNDFSTVHNRYKEQEELISWKNTWWNWMYQKTGYALKQEI